jgi:hypothetical protein
MIQRVMYMTKDCLTSDCQTVFLAIFQCSSSSGG